MAYMKAALDKQPLLNGVYSILRNMFRTFTVVRAEDLIGCQQILE
jgi:hypothetical protein